MMNQRNIHIKNLQKIPFFVEIARFTYLEGGKLVLVLARFTLIGKDINFIEIYGDKICQIDHSSTVLLDIIYYMEDRVQKILLF